LDPQAVREQAQGFCAALVAGDMDRAGEDLSQELRSNLGQLVAILPLPLIEATIESVEVGGSGYVAILHLIGENGETRLQTRWKDRDGQPTIVEASHVAEATAAGPETPEADTEA
jgi:hypothetical protein